MKIAVASDHEGYALKMEIRGYIEQLGHEVIDFGTHNDEVCDVPDYIYPAAMAVSNHEVHRGIFVDGQGYTSAMIANKMLDVYAAVCQDPYCASLARSHSDTNVLCLGSKIVGEGIALEIVKTWLSTKHLSNVEHYAVRVNKVKEISERHIRKIE